MQLLSIGETAAELGVAVGTLRRWHRQGLLMPFGRTVGGHRRYQRDTVRATLGAEPVVQARPSATPVFPRTTRPNN
jgi:predicted site-specific integrase-resolvase